MYKMLPFSCLPSLDRKLPALPSSPLLKMIVVFTFGAWFAVYLFHPVSLAREAHRSDDTHACIPPQLCPAVATRVASAPYLAPWLAAHSAPSNMSVFLEKDTSRGSLPPLATTT
jgi:hypothetical protein